ncbi:MAG TPA: DUF1801 domain-containing protein [Candidatus Saccharimonadales bacterium]|nr:DUF1801 domain-containing protein [Candidatus Saccharimonadales bacterium]
MKRSDFKTVEDYISTFPEEIQEKLQTIRATIKKAAPEATEKISYQIPTFVFHGNLIHYAAFKDHWSLFPGAAGVEHFKEELGDKAVSKGTIQFSLDEPLPLSLITRITEFRVKQNSSPRKS